MVRSLAEAGALRSGTPTDVEDVAVQAASSTARAAAHAPMTATTGCEAR